MCTYDDTNNKELLICIFLYDLLICIFLYDLLMYFLGRSTRENIVQADTLQHQSGIFYIFTDIT